MCSRSLFSFPIAVLFGMAVFVIAFYAQIVKQHKLLTDQEEGTPLTARTTLHFSCDMLRAITRVVGRAAAPAKGAKPKAGGDKKSGGTLVKKTLGGAAPSGKAAKGTTSATDKLNELYLQCLEPPPKPMCVPSCFSVCG